MCLIAHRPGSSRKRGAKHIPWETAYDNTIINPDGFGIMWRKNARSGIQAEKFAPDDAQSFLSLLAQIDGDYTLEYAAHWRLATHGPKIVDLAHPFWYEDVDGPVGVMHNGIINISTGKNSSDTSEYVERVLAYMPSRFWEIGGLRWAVGASISASRLLLMPTAHETVQIGTWVDGKSGLKYSTWPMGLVTKKNEPVRATTNTADSPTVPTVKLIPKTASRQSEIPITNKPPSWNGGHKLTFTVPNATDENGDGYGECACEKCHTTGEWYLIDGKYYIDIKHAEIVQ